jgi:hypothetical protein
MKTFPIVLALAAGCALTHLPGTARAASDHLLRLEGIRGEYRPQASTMQWQWSLASAAGGFNPFEPAFTGGVTVAVGALDGRWSTFALTVAAADGQPRLRYELKDAIITSYSVGGHGGRNAAEPQTWLKLSDFSAVAMTWRPPQPDGSAGDPVVGQWDRATGRFDGEVAVLDAFGVLGAARWPDGTLVLTSAVPEPATWLLWLMGGTVAAWRSGRWRQMGAG